MNYIFKKFLVVFIVLSIPCLMVPALASTSVARYRASNPLVAGGSSDTWSYPAWMSEDNSAGYEYPTSQVSPSALEETQNYLQETPQNTAVTPWQGSRDMVQPVYVANSEVMQFNQPSSGMQHFNKPSSWFGRKNYYKDSDDMPVESQAGSQQMNKIGSADKQGLKKGRHKRKEMTEQQYFHDQQDRYAHRKQMFKDALIILLTKYAIHHMTDEEAEQEENKILASFNRDLAFYQAIPQEQVDTDVNDIMNEYMLEKENIKNEKFESQRQLDSKYFVRLNDGKNNYAKPHTMMSRYPKAPSEDIIPLEEAAEIYYHPELSKKVSRKSLMQDILPSEELEVISPLSESNSSKRFNQAEVESYAKEHTMMSRFQKIPSEDIMPLEETEEIYYHPELSKKVSRPSLSHGALASEEAEMTQEPRVAELIVKQPDQGQALSTMIAQSKPMFRTDREKQIARDMIHNKHIPFLKSKLRELNHRGMVTKSLLQNLIREYNLNISHPDDVSYAQGALQANFI